MTNKIREAAEAIAWDISDRRGIKKEWEMIDDDVIEEIIVTWMGIIEGATLRICKRTKRKGLYRLQCCDFDEDDNDDFCRFCGGKVVDVTTMRSD